MIRVAVSGAAGRMGREVTQTVGRQPDMKLAAAVDVLAAEPPIQTDLASALRENAADVLVDFTRGDAAPGNVATALSLGLRAVVGTTGISADALRQMDEEARKAGLSVLVAPNFSLGAVLMMRFAQEAAQYYEWAEIIELHHEKKIDAPSGTALRTADLMRERRSSFGGVAGETEKVKGVRGGLHGGVRIHSVRLAGLVAHQEVLLGGEGETLTLRHDSMSRQSFMPGVMLAIRRIHTITGLVVGLEHLM